MAPPEECQVCRSPAEGHHFGIASCKACAAFFRRSMAESKTYQCKHSNSCEMYQNKRNQCRACRLQKCHNLGMKRDDILEAPVPQTSQTFTEHQQGESGSVSPPISSSSPFNAIQFPNVSSTLLYRMSQFHQNFLSSQKSLFKINNLTSTNILQTDIPFKQATIEQHNNMENANASLIASMLHDYFPFLKAVNKDDKKHFFGSFAVRFISFHKAWMTAEYLTGHDLVALQYGYYSNCSLPNVREFFGDIENLPEVASIIQPVGMLIKKTAQKLTEMNMTEMEVGGIVGAIFYTQLSQTDLWSDERLTEHDELIIGLHNHLLNGHGVSQGGLRFARILSLLLDLEKIESQSTNMHILSNFVLTDNNKKLAILQDSFI